jgi:hypothetical protein
MNRREKLRLDGFCLLALTLIWAAFFWRMLTPIQADQASLTQGDFSAQFVTFGAYQYARLTAGEVPLWNPYNNGGLPFIADTQAAVFYPPRLLTIALAHVSGTGWTYHALELEMMFHVLFYTLTFYVMMRQLTLVMDGSHAGSMVGAVVAGYGGYLTGYPPLQLALLEAGIWLPLVIIGLTAASRGRLRWLLLTGWALGLSWMAGHPQTSYFLTLLAVAYWGYRVWLNGLGWWVWLRGTASFGLLSIGVVAVTLFPGIEYLIQTSRAEFGFEAKAGGFPYRDVLQVVFPHVFSLFSPLYIGVVGLFLAGVGVFGRFQIRGTLFWTGIAVLTVLFSVGGEGGLYHVMYNVLPGLRFFRGQERVAFLFANSMAVLAALGTVWLASANRPPLRLVRRAAWGLALTLVVMAVFASFLAFGDAEAFGPLSEAAASSGLFMVLAAGILTLWTGPRAAWFLLVLLCLELLGANIDRPSNFDPIPPQAQLTDNPLLGPVLADDDGPFRVDGLRVLGGNYGSYYGVMDIQGISPLFLNGPQEIIEDGLPDERAWELFSVRYVWSDWQALPVPWERVAQGEDARGPVNLFRLTAQRPFAHLLYQVVTVESDEEARRVLADPNFDPRVTAVLHRAPEALLPADPPSVFGTTVLKFAPESLTVAVDTPTPAILSLAMVDYPGWRASIDGRPAAPIRAYGGLVALEVPAGSSVVEWVYDPPAYRVGAFVSLVTWVGLGLLAVIGLAHRLLTGKRKALA